MTIFGLAEIDGNTYLEQQFSDFQTNTDHWEVC